jgi:hypothetical protein
MKLKIISPLIILIVCKHNCFSQFKEAAIPVLVKLDSIRSSTSVSKHFASLYFDVTSDAITHFSNSKPSIQRLMGRLEIKFADYFFKAVYAQQNKTPMPREWKAYYCDTTAPGLCYILMGINAHINGDIWQALVNEFSQKEIGELKPAFLLYRKQLLKNYRDIYESASESGSRIKLLHALSFGFDKVYGKILLRLWRKRQMKLAELYYSNKSQFEKKLNRLSRKMDGLNELIRKNI